MLEIANSVLSRQSLAGPCASIQNFRFWFGLAGAVGLILA